MIDVTAIIVTRGNVPMDEILDSLIFPTDAVRVWDNAVNPDLGAFGRYVLAAGADTPYVYFQDDDLLVPEDAQWHLLQEYRERIDVLLTNMPTQDYRPGDVRPYLHHLVWQGWGSLIETQNVMGAHARWLRAGQVIDEDYLLVGCDVVFGTLTPWRRIDLDAARSTGLHGDDRPRTSAMPDDYERKMRFYLAACRILDVPDYAEIWRAYERETQASTST